MTPVRNRNLRSSAALLILAGALPALAGEEPAPAPAPASVPAPEPVLEHPVWSNSLHEEVMRFQGGVEAGFRFVGGDDGGSYDQDVHLDQGFRLFAADIEGTALRDGLFADTVSFHARGVGDPDRRLDFRMGRNDVYNLDLHADRLDRVFSAAGELNPYESVRTSEGGRLRFRPAQRLEVTLSTERLRREGDADLSQVYRDDQPFPAATVLSYDGRFHSVGVDATPGVFRVGGTWSFSRATDLSRRVLDRPDSPERDLGTYLNDSDVAHDTFAGRVGARLFKGVLDLSGDGGYRTGSTETSLRDDYVVSTPGPDGIKGNLDDEAWTQTDRGTSSADLRGRWWRGQALLRLREDWELLGWYEHRDASERGLLDHTVEAEPVGVDFGPPVREVASSRADSSMARTGLEARWRATREWRFRGGWERIRERVHTEEPAEFDRGSWGPVTQVGTAGADWVPSNRFNASLLLRAASATDPGTQLSPGDARSLSLRLRAKRPDGFHGTSWIRLKDRREGDANADSSVDSYGFLFGGANDDGFFEITADRRSYTVASDTTYVVDLVPGSVKTPHRVRFEEDVNSAAVTFSHRVKGPLRAFTSASWSDARGDYDWVRYDASLGLGWRLSPSTELRLEARRIVFNEKERSADDYRADLLTASVLWEF